MTIERAEDAKSQVEKQLSELGARRASATTQLGQLTREMRQLAWILYDTHGLSARAIARIAGISDVSVGEWLAKEEEDGS